MTAKPQRPLPLPRSEAPAPAGASVPTVAPVGRPMGGLALAAERSPGPVRSELLQQLAKGGDCPERRWSPSEGAVCNFVEFCRRWLECLGEQELVHLWQQCQVVPRAFASARAAGGRRFLLLRHGSRPDSGHDPSLDSLGFQQAKQAATFLQRELREAPVRALFSSPYLRTLQTAAPVSEALGMPIRVEWGFGELMAKGWLQHEDPLPTLRSRGFHGLPMSDLLHASYKSAVMPSFPELEGRARPGDARQRERAAQRHGLAAEAALSEAGGGSILVVCHGSTHDFVLAALCPEWHPPERQTPACVPHCGITQLVEQAGGGWWPSTFGSTPWQQSPATPMLRSTGAAVPKELGRGGAGAGTLGSAAMEEPLEGVAGLGSGARALEGGSGPRPPHWGFAGPRQAPGSAAAAAAAAMVARKAAGTRLGLVTRPIFCPEGPSAPHLRPGGPSGGPGPSRSLWLPVGARRGRDGGAVPRPSTAVPLRESDKLDGETLVRTVQEPAAPAATTPSVDERAEEAPAAAMETTVGPTGVQDEQAEEEKEGEVLDLCFQCQRPCSQQAEDGKFYCDPCWKAWTAWGL